MNTELTTQNEVTLKAEYKNGLVSAKLWSNDREVDMWLNKAKGTWSLSLSKRNYIGDMMNTRTYTNLTESEALIKFDKKQHELGFFKK
jgi:hypothetical protein